LCRVPGPLTLVTLSSSPRLLLINGNIHTVDAKDRVVEAIAIAGGKIEATGSTESILAASGDAHVYDLGGRSVVPGFIDSHAHIDREGQRRAHAGLGDCRSIADVQDVVRREAARAVPGGWVLLGPLGRPPFHLDQTETLAEGRYPDRHDLDAVAPDHPVWIQAPWGYWSNRPPFVHVLNSAALRSCGITRDSRAGVPSVEIERDPTGEPTGRILERYYTLLAEHDVLRAAPRITPEVRLGALRLGTRLALESGTTGVFEGHGVAAELLESYRKLRERDELAIRAWLPYSLPPWRTVDEVERMVTDWAHLAAGRGFGDEWLRLTGVYLAYGGDPRVRDIVDEAWPYTGIGGWKDQANDHDEYAALCRLFARRGLRVGTIVGGAHAAGDTLDRVLSVWEAVDREWPIRHLRWVLEHATIVDAERDVPRIRRLGAVLTTQPGSYLHRSGLEAVESGIEAKRWMPFRDWTEAGLTWSLSTDNKPYQMLFAIWTAMARTEIREGRVLAPDQCLTFDQALRAATRAGAAVCLEEDRRGTLEPGKLADLVVLSDDARQLAPAKIRDLGIDLTMIGGRVMHVRSGSGFAAAELMAEGGTT
jgi:predicted amidohydrolase YtcJ